MPSVAGSSARPSSACQPREDMIIVQFTCESLCAIPDREISVAARLARPGCSAEPFETTASAGGREVARATHLARSQDRRRPGDLPAPRSRRGRRMSRLRRHGPAGRTGTCPDRLCTGWWSRGHDRTGHGGAHRSTRSRTTWRHKSQPVSEIGMPKLWAYTSSRGTAVASTS
jgi:hypothetical protein